MNVSDKILIGYKNILLQTKLIISDEEKDRIKTDYKVQDPSKICSPNTHKRICGEAIRLCNAVIDYGGTKNELKQAVTYLTVCMDAEKYMLDWKRYLLDHHVDDLFEKYVGR